MGSMVHVHVVQALGHYYNNYLLASGIPNMHSCYRDCVYVASFPGFPLFAVSGKPGNEASVYVHVRNLHYTTSSHADRFLDVHMTSIWTGCSTPSRLVEACANLCSHSGCGCFCNRLEGRSRSSGGRRRGWL